MNFAKVQKVIADPNDVRGPVPKRKVIPHEGTNLQLKTFLNPNGYPTAQTTVPVTTPPENFNGLGDRLAAITSKLGIKQCDGCKKRQQTLNRMFPAKGGK